MNKTPSANHCVIGVFNEILNEESMGFVRYCGLFRGLALVYENFSALFVVLGNNEKGLSKRLSK